MTKNTFSILVFTLLSQFAFSQTVDKVKLDNYFQALEINNKFMGSVAISQNGKVIYAKQIGFADIENHVRPNDSTKYRIGSISKIFTAVLVFKAIEEKKLNLSDKIDKYFPTIKNAKKITISNLLNHRSGIPHFTEVQDYRKWNIDKKSEKELIQMIEKNGSEFEPDTEEEYSNSNFVLLSFIVQNVYKKEYAQLLKEKITVPTGLKNTYFGKPFNIKDNECYSYRYRGKWEKEPETVMSIPLGASAIVATPGDLVKFADALLSGKIVSNQNLELMKKRNGNHGMGLSRLQYDHILAYGHEGLLEGFNTFMYHFTEQNITMALTSNGTNFDNIINNNILTTLIKAIYYNHYEIPKFTTIGNLSEE